MSTSVLALPISIEQLATVIRRMTPADRQRLLDLVPELRQEATGSPQHSTRHRLRSSVCGRR